MPLWVVRPGDCVASLAARAGVSMDDIWNHPDNEALRARREDPHMLCPGDEIEVPEPVTSRASIRPGGTHRFERQAATVELRLRLLDEPIADGVAERRHEQVGHTTRIHEPTVPDPPPPVPLANAPYRLHVGGRRIEGTTDGDGVLLESVDPIVTSAVLVLFPDTAEARKLDLRIGYLDPPDESSGQAQRLSNLGFPNDDATLVRAVEAYQQSRGLEITGEVDDATKQRLLEEAGS